ncbi:putative reverse transcriptase domain-containing protein [Tanacetum coccineum]
MIDSRNNNGMHDGNVGQSLISSTTGPNIGIVQINISDSHTTDPNHSSPSLLGPTSYAKLVTGESSRKSVNFHTLLGPAGNGVDVAISLESVRAIKDVGNVPVWVKFHGVPMKAFSEDGLSAIATKLGSPLMLDSYTSNMCLGCKVFGHVLDECPKNIISDVEKNLKNPRQAARGIQVGPNVAFKPIKQVYRHVSNRNNVSFSGKKKQVAVASKEVGNSNPFDVLNSVEKDDDLGTNGRHEKSSGKGSNSDMFHGFFNLAYSSTSTTPIVERIYNIKRQINGKRTLMDDDGKPLPKVVSTVNVDSDSEVEDVVDDHEVFMKSTRLKRGADSGFVRTMDDNKTG